MSNPVSVFDRTLSRRQTVAGLASLGIGAAAAIGLVARSRAQEGTDAVSLPTFRRAGDTDDTAALLRAAETGRPIHAPAGGGSAGGRYAVAMTAADELPTRFQLFGDGMAATVFVRSYARPAPFVLHADSRSAAVADNLTGWRIADLTFADDVAGRGFAEHDYLVMLSGVTDAQFARVGFRGFRGDGLYLGSSTVRANERHNRDVVVSDCLFDGVNANNRNAISVIDCDGLVVERSRFVNVTRPGNGIPGTGDPMNPRTGPAMPGAIDFEPDEGFSIVRNVTIRGNQFTGGGGFAVTLALGSNAGPRFPRQGFVIEDNVVSGRRGAFAAIGYGGGDAATGPDGYAVTIRRNRVTATDKPFLIDGMRGLTMSGNEFTDCAEMAELGYQGANAGITMTDNRFTRVGLDKGYGLWIRGLADAQLTGNTFADCGRADGGQGIAIAFFEGRARRVTLTGNRFTSPLGRTTLALKVFPAARLDRATVVGRSNVVALPGAAADPSLGLSRVSPGRD